MSWFFSWYLIVTLLGWLTFPLAFRMFPALADRGYSLARALGLLVWGYIFWLLTSLGLSQNNIGGLLLGLLLLAALSLLSLQTVDRRHHKTADDNKLIFGLSSALGWIRHNRKLVLNVEALFFLAFAFLAFVRASNPELTSAEKPMELMFINSILRSPTFPPHDSWLSGYAISYYYFGYVMTAMLAKLTNVPGSAAHNLMTSLVFALGAVGSYGILYNLLSKPDQSETQPAEKDQQSSPHRLAFLAPLFLLIVSNLEGFLEVLHKRGLFWSNGTSTFWSWLDIKDLTNPPASLGWVPDRYLWWWRASRVISDYDLTGAYKEIIDEFPFFSFLHADLHPHVLAIPFGLLAIAIALHIYRGGARGTMRLLGYPLRLRWDGFLLVALTLGGLAFLNTWDILIMAALVVGAYVLDRVHEAGWSWDRLEDVFILGLPLGVLSILLYLPFYLGFSSQAGGILPNVVYPTRGAQFWVMFAPLLLPLLAYFVYAWRGEKRPANWKLGFGLILGLTFLLWIFSWLLAWAISIAKPDLATLFLQAQGVENFASLFGPATLVRMANIGGLLTMLAMLIPSLAFLAADRSASTTDDGRTTTDSYPSSFVFLLIVLGGLLVLAPEFVYLRDQFGWRINTVFKFYYQAWMLWTLAAAFGTALLLQNLRGIWDKFFSIGLVVLLVMALAYPVFGLATRTNDFQLERATSLLTTITQSDDPAAVSAARVSLSHLWTLDYFVRVQEQDPDEAAAIRWLDSAPEGVIVEAVGGSYTGYARISTYTGLPSVLGWPGHESQWRGGYVEQGSRKDDIETLYSVTDWGTASEILSRYHIRYVYVGALERNTYTVHEEKFQRYLSIVFQQGQVTIYEVP